VSWCVESCSSSDLSRAAALAGGAPVGESRSSHTISLILETHSDVDILSTSAIHQGCGIVDFSLKIQKKASA